VSAKALVKSRAEYDAMYKRSVEDPVGFWSDQAKQFHWCGTRRRLRLPALPRGALFTPKRRLLPHEARGEAS
jgi:hypothetical protein